MCRLDIVRVIVSPCAAHALRIPMVGDHVVIIGELLVADGAYPGLLSDFPVQQLPHLGWRSQFPVPSRVMGILNSLNSKSDQLGPEK
jgi:hypothetical protein